MGTYYINRFWSEIDNSVNEKLDIPRVLMEQRALNFDAVTDFSALEGLIQERVADAFIAKSDGKVFYSHDPSRIGKQYSLFLDKNDPLHEEKLDNSKKYHSTYTSVDGQKYISVQSPLMVDNRLLGTLHISIYSEKIQEEKTSILYLLLLGSLVTICLTTLLEALLVHRLIVPRVNRTSSILQKVEDGDLTARISPIGAPDQLGLIMEQINSMISATEQNINTLRLLGVGGEAFTKVSTPEKVDEIFYSIMQEHFGRPLSNDEADILGELATSGANKRAFEKSVGPFLPERNRKNSLLKTHGNLSRHSLGCEPTP